MVDIGLKFYSMPSPTWDLTWGQGHGQNVLCKSKFLHLCLYSFFPFGVLERKVLGNCIDSWPFSLTFYLELYIKVERLHNYIIKTLWLISFIFGIMVFIDLKFVLFYFIFFYFFFIIIFFFFFLFFFFVVVFFFFFLFFFFSAPSPSWGMALKSRSQT